MGNAFAAWDRDPPHENSVRKWLAAYSSERMEYRAFRTPAEARRRSDAVAVLDLDAEPYEPLATFPARRVEADEAALDRLRVDLGTVLARVMGPEAPAVAGRVRFETSEVLDRESGATRLDGVALREELRWLDLEAEVEAVFLGLRPAVGADVFGRVDRRLAWWEAVDRGDVDAARDLIDGGVPIEAARRYDRSALFAATRGGDVAMVRLLLERGADPNRPDAEGRTSTTFAATGASHPSRGDGDAVLRLLLAAGGRLGFREAVILGDVELARRILDADPTIDVSGDARLHYSYPFLMVAASFGRLDMARFLLDRGADVHATDDDVRVTALHAAAAGGWADVVRLLLDRGADLDHINDFGFTPLASAAENGRAEVVRLLLDRGARRVLADAVILNDADLIAKLPPTVGKEDCDLDLILFRCRRHLVRCDPGALRLLPRARSKGGGIALDGSILGEAAGAGRRDVVRLLLEFGFDPGKPDATGATPAEHAERAGHVEIAELLRSATRSRKPDASR